MLEGRKRAISHDGCHGHFLAAAQATHHTTLRTQIIPNAGQAYDAGRGEAIAGKTHLCCGRLRNVLGQPAAIARMLAQHLWIHKSAPILTWVNPWGRGTFRLDHGWTEKMRRSRICGPSSVVRSPASHQQLARAEQTLRKPVQRFTSACSHAHELADLHARRFIARDDIGLNHQAHVLA